MSVQDDIDKAISIGGEETTIFEIMSLFRSEGSCEPTVREALVRMADMESLVREAAENIDSNIAWLEDQAAQRSVIPDIEAMILRSFSDDNQE